MGFATEGFKTVAQDHISRNIASNFYGKLPFIAALGSITVTRNKKTPLNIGRPNEGTLLTGKVMSPGETMNVQNFNSYKPRIQRFATNNSKWMGKYDTNPVVASPTTNAHSQATQATALFNAAELKTPILVWHRDKERALQSSSSSDGQGIAMSQIIDEATEIAYQEHVGVLNTGIWSGNPTSQTDDPWDAPLGLLQALSATNTYGNVDRSDSGNAVWRAQADSTFKAVDLNRIVDDINLTKKLRTKGSGVDLIVTTPDIYSTFKAQAQGVSGIRMLPEGLPGMAKWGYTGEALQKDNCMVIYDETCPANNLLALTMRTWRCMFRPGKNLTVEPFVDISRQTEGAKNADQAFIKTELIFACDNPYLNALYTAIGT